MSIYKVARNKKIVERRDRRKDAFRSQRIDKKHGKSQVPDVTAKNKSRRKKRRKR